ncbi:hypothetical protein RBA41_23255 [Massilia sp. CCM 9210]|uniref:hypothetical protein n=1 Tax=Massilia scottii TaxID=3057166 RepID=UPI002796A2D5|nr:hypothetical protein [Massilia sp. CCM 9210]MDQ1816222.1 hypothetical protein [Massilia sp. CCM 9210]
MLTLFFLLPPLLIFAGCVTEYAPKKTHPNLDTAVSIFKDRCRLAGEKIYKTVDDVEGVFILKIRPVKTDLSDQFELHDPYGRDFRGDFYVRSFLHGAYAVENNRLEKLPADFPPHIAYAFAEAIDAVDGKRYRYTGKVEEPWLTDKSYLKGHKRFVFERSLATGPAPRYGVTYDDISTRFEREHWIAGSSLKVIDLHTNEVIAERIGYLFDSGQGSKIGGRVPWLWAANNSCPSFGSEHAFTAQLDQAAIFVEKVLRPHR